MTHSLARRFAPRVALCLTLCFISGLLPTAANAVEADAAALHGSLEAGQVWRYDGLPGNEDSRIIIGKVETLPVLGDAVHVTITNVTFTDPRTHEQVTTNIDHLPISVEALHASLTVRDGSAAPSPEFASGYQTWRASFDQKRSGIFRTPLKDVLAGIEKTAFRSED